MKIGDLELSEKRIIIIAIASCVFAIFLVYQILYAPLIRNMKSKSAECKTSENELAECRQIIDSSGKIYGERVLIKEEEISLAIDELTKSGKSLGVNFISIKPRDIIDTKARFKILPIEMELTATDKKFSEFIGSLDELKKGLIKVESFNIAPSEESGTTLNVKMVINLYISGR